MKAENFIVVKVIQGKLEVSFTTPHLASSALVFVGSWRNYTWFRVTTQQGQRNMVTIIGSKQAWCKNIEKNTHIETQTQHL